MLQVIGNSVQELSSVLTVTSGGYVPTTNTGISENIGYYQPYTYWYNYPVYICTDKTKKAIEILKTLQAEKLLECKSVNKFIELVEKISSIL